MPQQTSPPLLPGLTRRLDAVEQARTAADVAARAELEARDQSRAHRALLASEIRGAAEAYFGTITAFCKAVHDAHAIPERSVWNALYSTFSADYLARCVEVLADLRLAPPASGDGLPADATPEAGLPEDGQSRQAA